MALPVLLPLIAHTLRRSHTAMRFIAPPAANLAKQLVPASKALVQGAFTNTKTVSVLKRAALIEGASPSLPIAAAVAGTGGMTTALFFTKAPTSARLNQGGYQSHPSGPTWHVGGTPERRKVFIEKYLPAEAPSPVLLGGQKLNAPMNLEGFRPVIQGHQDFLLFKQDAKKSNAQAARAADTAATAVSNTATTTAPANAYADITPIEELAKRWYEVRDSQQSPSAKKENNTVVSPSLVLPLGRKAGHRFAARVMDGGTKQTFEGHGAYFHQHGTTVVPPGVRITTANPGFKVTGPVATRMASGTPQDWVELGQLANKDVRIAEQTEGMATWLSGAEIPNFTLGDPGPTPNSSALEIYEKSTTVGHKMQLSRLFFPHMGPLVWAACVAFKNGVPRVTSAEPVVKRGVKDE